MDAGVIVKISFVLIFCIAFPTALTLWWKKKTGESIWCFVVGALMFFVFANLLESTLMKLIRTSDSPLIQSLWSTPALYVIFACLISGLFEETARLVGFAFLLEDHDEKACATAYGIGHGGMEVLVVVGLTYLTYLLGALGTSFGNEATDALVSSTIQSLTWGKVFTVVLERISAMMIHIGLSMLVFTAVRYPQKRFYFPLAILLHALMNVPSALYQTGSLSSLAAVEILAFICGVGSLLYGISVLYSIEPGQQTSGAPKTGKRSPGQRKAGPGT